MQAKSAFRSLPLIIVVAVMCIAITAARAAPPAPVVAPTNWKLRVDGVNTDDGFVITHVTPGGPASRRGLEVKDIILEVDGVPVDRNWTLRNALQDSGGIVDIVVLDHRTGREIPFRNVRLAR